MIEILDDTDISANRSQKKNGNTTQKIRKGKKYKKSQIPNEIKKEKAIVENKKLKLCYENRENEEDCYSYLQEFYNSLTVIDLENLITKENLNYFENLNPNDNVQIDLLLSKIYGKILSSEDFYNKYFFDKEENKNKLQLVLSIIDESIQVIDSFSDYFISFENFKLKENLLKLIKFIFINLKDDLSDEEKEHLKELINELPKNYFSENYLKLRKYKNIVYKSNNELLKNIEDIDNLFFDCSSYYEQLNCIQLLLNDIEMENLEKNNNYSQVTINDIKNKKKIKKKKKTNRETNEEENEEKSKNSKNINKNQYNEEVIILYGEFILKLCLYYQFYIKNKTDKKRKTEKIDKKEEKKIQEQEEIDEKMEEEEDDEEEEENKKIEESKNIKNNKNAKNKNIKNKKDKIEEEEEEEDLENVVNIFINDDKKITTKKNKTEQNFDIEELLDDKICVSLYEKENLFEIIKKNAENFKILTKTSKSDEIINIKEQLSIYLNDINNNKIITIDINELNNIKYFNNFSKNTILVPNRNSKTIYIENDEDKKSLLFIEFFLTDEKKDIIFRLSRYIPKIDDFKEIYCSGKINKKFKMVVYFEEKSLYQIEFHNEYSFINSKEINFTISLININDKEIKTSEENEEKENTEINNKINIDIIDNENKEKKIKIIDNEEKNENINNEEKNENIINEEKNENFINEEKNENIINEEKSLENNDEKKNENFNIEEKKEININEEKNDNINNEENHENNNNGKIIENINNEEKNENKIESINKDSKNKTNNEIENKKEDKIENEKKDKIENEKEDKIENEKEDKKESQDNKELQVSGSILNNRRIIKFKCKNDEQNYIFNCNKIYKKIKGYQHLLKNNLIVNNVFKLQILVYLNQLRIITFYNYDKMFYKEIIDENQQLITKEFFNNIIINYLNQNYKDNNKKIVINLYSLNKNLSLISNKIQELINALKDNSTDDEDQIQNMIKEQYLKKLGFYLDGKIGEYDILYNLYDFSDQCLIYHLFLVHCQEKYVDKTTLVMLFDKKSLHISAINNEKIYNKFESLEKEWSQNYYSQIKMNDFKSIADFITATFDSFQGFDLVLSYMNSEDKKDDLLSLFNQIKEYVNDKLDEEMNVYIYHEESLVRNVFKYINLFSYE